MVNGKKKKKKNILIYLFTSSKYIFFKVGIGIADRDDTSYSCVRLELY
jgi:hypothetical protein